MQMCGFGGADIGAGGCGWARVGAGGRRWVQVVRVVRVGGTRGVRGRCGELGGADMDYGAGGCRDLLKRRDGVTHKVPHEPLLIPDLPHHEATKPVEWVVGWT